MSTVMAAPTLQAIPVGASGTWTQNPQLAQHYYPAQTYQGGMQAPANLFHDPNIINTNVPGTMGTQFVMGQPNAPQMLTMPQLMPPTLGGSTVFPAGSTVMQPMTTTTTIAAPATTLAAPVAATPVAAAPAKRDAKAAKKAKKKKKSCGSC